MSKKQLLKSVGYIFKNSGVDEQVVKWIEQKKWDKVQGWVNHIEYLSDTMKGRIR